MTTETTLPPALLLLASTEDGFELYERPQQNSNGWLNLKLVNDRHTEKQNWWFGWNGERLSGSRDAHLLKEHLPHVYAWVIDSLCQQGELK